jgi:hypothetical protein
VGEQVVEVLEVALQPLLDVGELVDAALEVVVGDHVADRHGGEGGVAAPVDRHAHRHEQVRAAQRHEGEDEPRDEPSVGTELGGWSC